MPVVRSVELNMKSFITSGPGILTILVNVAEHAEASYSNTYMISKE